MSGQCIPTHFTFRLPVNTRAQGRYVIAKVEITSTPPDSYPDNDIQVFGPLP